MTFAIVLATAGDAGHATALGLAAQRAGHEVSLFLMDDGVAALGAPELATLVDEGAEVVACATSLTLRALEAPAGVVAGSQDDHARLVSRADRVVAFT